MLWIFQENNNHDNQKHKDQINEVGNPMILELFNFDIYKLFFFALLIHNVFHFETICRMLLQQPSAIHLDALNCFLLHLFQTMQDGEINFTLDDFRKLHVIVYKLHSIQAVINVCRTRSVLCILVFGCRLQPMETLRNFLLR